MIASNITQWRREFDVRLVLGATRSTIVRLVVAESVRFALLAPRSERWWR